MIGEGPFFDRRVPAALMEALGGDGAFSWVTEHARRPLEPGFALDLGLRASPKSPHIGHATLSSIEEVVSPIGDVHDRAHVEPLEAPEPKPR